MNERIKEMYNQCFVELENDTPNIGFDFEKFADLIIQECLLALEPNLYESDIEYRVDQAIYKRCERIILKHFGIEQ